MKINARELFAAALTLVGSALLGETYTLSGTDAMNASSLNGTGTYGWNGIKTHVPCAGNDYVVGGTGGTVQLRSVQDGGDYAFAGDSLTFRDGGELLYKSGGAVMTVANLIVDGGTAVFRNGQDWANAIMEGQIAIEAGAVLEITVAAGGTADPRHWSVRSAVVGSGALRLTGNANTFQDSKIAFRDLRLFTGPVAVSDAGKAIFTFGGKFPADPAEPMADGFAIEGALVQFKTNGTFGVNRGFSFARNGTRRPTVFVDAGYTVTIKGPLTGVGFDKTGEGKLSLTGSSPSLEGITLKEGTLFLRGEALPLVDRCTVEGGSLEYSSRIAYVDLDAPIEHRPPYNTPERAAPILYKALQTLEPGGRIVLSGGNYDVEKANALVSDFNDLAFTVEGPTDRSAFVSGSLSVQSNQTWASVTYDATTQLTVGPGAVVSNMTICGSDKYVVHRGTMVGCILSNFTGACAVNVRPVDDGRYILRDTTITGCHFAKALEFGGSMAASAPIVIGGNGTANCFSLELENCSVSNNYAEIPDGTYKICAGVIAMNDNKDGAFISANRCRFVDNSGRNAVARLGNVNMRATLFATNCLVAGNRSLDDGQDAFWGRVKLVNCTLVDNGANSLVVGKGSAMGTDRTILVKNCVVVGNTVKSGSAFRNADNAAVFAIDHSIGQGVTSGNGNLAGSVAFYGTHEDPYRLKKTSPGRDAGDASVWTADDLDVVGNPRLREGLVDMGCYQWWPRQGLMIIVE